MLGCVAGAIDADSRTVTYEIAPPAAASTAHARMAVETLSLKSTALNVVSRPTAAGRTATASNPARRAAALLTPDAIPNSSGGTAPRTVAVSGATVIARPRPNTTAAGKTVVK